MAFYEGMYSVIIVLPMHFSWHFQFQCCGHMKKWDAMFFVSIPTIKYGRVT